MTITAEDLNIIAKYFQMFIDMEYSEIYVSRNLANTTFITKDLTPNKEKVSVHIPAKIYDMDLFTKKGVIVYKNTGSYASANDIEGGFSKVHKNFVERGMRYAINRWLREKKGQERNYNVEIIIRS